MILNYGCEINIDDFYFFSNVKNQKKSKIDDNVDNDTKIDCFICKYNENNSLEKQLIQLKNNEKITNIIGTIDQNNNNISFDLKVGDINDHVKKTIIYNFKSSIDITNIECLSKNENEISIYKKRIKFTKSKKENYLIKFIYDINNRTLEFNCSENCKINYIEQSHIKVKCENKKIQIVGINIPQIYLDSQNNIIITNSDGIKNINRLYNFFSSINIQIINFNLKDFHNLINAIESDNKEFKESKIQQEQIESNTINSNDIFLENYYTMYEENIEKEIKPKIYQNLLQKFKNYITLSLAFRFGFDENYKIILIFIPNKTFIITAILFDNFIPIGFYFEIRLFLISLVLKIELFKLFKKGVFFETNFLSLQQNENKYMSLHEKHFDTELISLILTLINFIFKQNALTMLNYIAIRYDKNMRNF